MRISLPSMVHSHWWEDLDQPHSLQNQYFGDGIHHDALHQAHRRLPLAPSLVHHFPARYSRDPLGYRRHWTARPSQGVPTVTPNKNSYHVSLDVQQFAPEEISVKLMDRSVIVEGKHDDKKDEHGWISRQFCRRYEIPEMCNMDQLQCTLSSDGVLAIIVPHKVEGEKTIPIVQTGKPAIVNTPVAADGDTPKRSLEAEDIQ
ncbi:alpha-crystallin A chain [Diachasma alloeum]|uniref:alpha-crystallin A chain n=1 Tax=Diachasma alloeum TaxID=454923 RepID=UPI00073815B5|nr:alpha-crystallin A chain [Diachasma alloeum]